MDKIIISELEQIDPSVSLQIGSRSYLSFARHRKYNMPFEVTELKVSDASTVIATLKILDLENRISDADIGSKFIIGRPSRLIFRGTLLKIIRST